MPSDRARAEYDFNLLASCPWGGYAGAKGEIVRILGGLGDSRSTIRPTLARGILGVKTSLDSRSVISCLRQLFEKNRPAIRHTLKWVPIDLWTSSDIESIRHAVTKLRELIGQGETWRMSVEKRRYTTFHKIEIIRQVAELIDQRVDLGKPDKIVRVEIIGPHAGISILKPEEIFSAGKT